MPVFAHAGHWAVQLMYLLPVIVILALVGWGRLQEKRGKRPARVEERRRGDVDRDDRSDE
jgi:hypothetical protein